MSPPHVPTRQALFADLRSIWSEIFGRQMEGPDDYFGNGGDSLSAAQMLESIWKHWGVRLNLSALAENSTLDALIELVLHDLEAGRTEPFPTAMPTLGSTDPFPLTDVQQAYWVGRSDVFEMGNLSTASYVEVDAPDLDVDRFRRALDRLVERHGMLRATISPDGMQRFNENAGPCPIEVIDRSDADPDAIEQSLARTRAEMATLDLDPAVWPLFDIRIHRLPDRVRLHVCMELLICDAHSLRILLAELAVLYRDPGADLPPLHFSFRDYVLAEKKREGSASFDQARLYWEGRLADLAPAPDLPLALDPSSLRAPRVTRRTATVDAETWLAIQTVAATHEVTPTIALCTAFARTLAAWTATPRFTLNLTTYFRQPHHPDVRRLVGDFTSVTLLEVDGFVEPLSAATRAVRDQLWLDLDHRAFSGVRVLRELGRVRGDHRRAWMPIVFTSALGADGTDEPSDDTWLGEGVFGAARTPQVWIDCQVNAANGRLEIRWDCVDEVFPPGLLDALFERFRTQVRSLAEPVTWSAPSIPGPSDPVAAAANDTRLDLGPDLLLHSAWLDAVEQFGDAPAVFSRDATLSHRELAAASSRIRDRLIERGVEPGDRVAISVPRGWREVASVLGVLRAGAAWVPLPPTLPPVRISNLAEQSGVSAWIVGEDASVPAGGNPIRLAASKADWIRPGAPDGDVTVLPDDLAYVIFTSGSGGRPKGVAVSHRAARNTILDVNRRWSVTSGDRVLGLSSFGFDLSVYDHLGPLSVGGAVVLPPEDDCLDPSAWTRWMHRCSVTIWNSVPRLMELWVTAMEAQEPTPTDLRLALLSGDWIPLDLVGRARAFVPECQFVSLGGATECAIWSVFHPIDAIDPAWASIPYGFPLANQTLHVLDDRGNERPPHATGEICIGGLGVARGYFGDAENTAKRFRSHPKWGRLHHTGDMGRRHPDGSIELLGRRDLQIKLGGWRIDLREIEAVLRSHEAVDAAIAVEIDIAGARALGAVFVPRQRTTGGSGTPAEATERLQKAAYVASQPGLRDVPADAGLPLATPPDDRDRFRTRRSCRVFDEVPVHRKALGELLATLRLVHLEDHGLPKRRYPSAGSLYSVQTYVYVWPGGVASLEAGLYYHHPERHQLYSVRPRFSIAPDFVEPNNRAVAEQAAFALFLVSDLGVIDRLYGPLARDFAMIEAGAMTQLLMEEAPGLGVGLCPIGTLARAEWTEGLDLSPDAVLLHTLLGGASTGPASPFQLADELARLLSEQLPDYMADVHLRAVPSLPLTANGKVDRTALSALLSQVRRPAPTPSTPRTASLASVERVITDAWERELRRSSIGLDDGFFDSGGDSVAAVRIRAELERILDRPIPLARLYEFPTIRSLAAWLSDGGTEAPSRARAAGNRDRRRQARLNARRGGNADEDDR